MSGTKVAKNAPPNLFLHFMASGFGGLRARQPKVQGRVATRYDIMKISCQLWSSVEVTYVHPPHMTVRNRPTPRMKEGRDDLEWGRAERKYHRVQRANRGPMIRY